MILSEKQEAKDKAKWCPKRVTNTTTEEIPEVYLTRKERIAIIKAGEGSDLDHIQRRLYLFNGIDFVTFE